MLPTIRLLIVDDHPLVREGLAARLASEADIVVVAEAGDARAAQERVADSQPDVVLMDIGMKDMNGIELTALLVQRHPALAVLMLSMFDAAEYAQRALQAGARGYVLKDSPSSEIVGAIRTVHGGGTHLSLAIAQKLVRPPAARIRLSAREDEILAALAQGLSSKQIARTLDLSVRTVETHRQSIRRKLDLAGQAELIKYAVEHARRNPH